MIIMPILFQYRLIRHFLGMYVTKHAEQEIYLIAQESNNGNDPHGCPSLSQWSIGLRLMKFDCRLSQLFWKWPQKDSRGQERDKKEETAR